MKIKIQATHPAELRSLNATFAPPIETEVEAEVIGDVLVYQSPTSKHWIVKNQRTGFTTNNVERSRAIEEAALGEPIGEIVLRVPMSKKNSYVKAAQPGKLAEWCVKVLDEAANAQS
jgi:hypothetical protein